MKNPFVHNTMLVRLSNLLFRFTGIGALTINFEDIKYVMKGVINMCPEMTNDDVAEMVNRVLELQIYRYQKDGVTNTREFSDLTVKVIEIRRYLTSTGEIKK